MGLLQLAAVAALLAAAAEPADDVLIAELKRRPAATAVDLYKLLHQSEYGPGHLIEDVAAARRHLAREMDGLGPTLAGEALREDLGDGLVRINLRPFRDAGGSGEDLVHAMVATARSIRGDVRRLDSRIEAACRTLERQGSRAAELRALAREQARKGHPALHHSEPYRQAYRPAYRVIHLRFLPPAGDSESTDSRAAGRSTRQRRKNPLGC